MDVEAEDYKEFNGRAIIQFPDIKFFSAPLFWELFSGDSSVSPDNVDLLYTLKIPVQRQDAKVYRIQWNCKLRSVILGTGERNAAFWNKIIYMQGISTADTSFNDIPYFKPIYPDVLLSPMTNHLEKVKLGPLAVKYAIYGSDYGDKAFWTPSTVDSQNLELYMKPVIYATL